MGMVGKLLNDLKRCVKKVYRQMISLLFVFCHLVAIQVLCIKALLCVNDHSLHDFCKTRTLHLHGWPSCLCWLSRGGREYYEAMSCKPHVAALGALISACRIHGNVEMAECAAKWILELQPENASAYVLLSTIYAAAGHRRLYENVQQQIQEQCLKKQSGCTWIEMNNDKYIS